MGSIDQTCLAVDIRSIPGIYTHGVTPQGISTGSSREKSIALFL